MKERVNLSVSIKGDNQTMQSNQHDPKNHSSEHQHSTEHLDKHPANQSKRFSRLQLGIFAGIFAIIGAIVIFRSFASTTPTTNTVASKAAYDTPDFYGVNIPSAIFPDARGTEGDGLMATLQSDVATTGSGWVRTDATASLDRAFFGNSEHGNCGQPFCDENKLAGKKILAVIDHVTFNEISALPCGVDSSRPPLEDLAIWEKIVDCVSRRYKGKVAAYEIWNEPTLPQFKLGYQDGSAQHYYDMLKSAYTIIKQNDPSAQVIGLGGVEIFSADTSSPTRLQDSKDFAQKVYDLGGAQYADAIAVHGYSWGNCGDAIWNTYEQNIKYYHEMWGKDVWITETGQSRDLACSQSKYIDYAYSAFINSSVKKVFWFALNDTADGMYGIADKEAAAHMASFISSPKLGQLRVETSPAAAASLSVHPGFVQTGEGEFDIEYRWKAGETGRA